MHRFLLVSLSFLFSIPTLLCAQEAMTFTVENPVVGLPGETLTVPLHVTHIASLAGVQVNVVVSDTNVAVSQGFELKDTVVDEMITVGAFKVEGQHGIAVASPTAQVYRSPILVNLRFRLKKPGKTPVSVRISLAVGDNPPISKKVLLQTNVVVDTQSFRRN